MSNNRYHISIRLVTLLLALTLVLPSVVKFTHALGQHEHEVCFEKNQSHFHEIDIDCDFYKFKLGNSFYFKIEALSLHEDFISIELQTTYHTYLKSHQQLTTYLRGPPYLT